METVLYYEPLALMSPAAITGVCRQLGLAVVPVGRDQVGQSVGELAGYPGVPRRQGGGEPPEERVLVFCGLPEEKLDQVLEALKAAGAPPALKAILTAANAGWSFARLARELSAEHRAMGGR